MTENHEKYAHLTEPTFGTVVAEQCLPGVVMNFRMMVYAPTDSVDEKSWQAVTNRGELVRFGNLRDIWKRVQNPGDYLVIIYDPRVDYEPN